MKKLIIISLSLASTLSFSAMENAPTENNTDGTMVTPQAAPVNLQTTKREVVEPIRAKTKAYKTDYVKTTNDMVRKSQASLAEQGYNVGAMDGVLGYRTRAAIKDFQRKNSLRPTGNLNQETLDELNVDSDYTKESFDSNQYTE